MIFKNLLNSDAKAITFSFFAHVLILGIYFFYYTKPQVKEEELIVIPLSLLSCEAPKVIEKPKEKVKPTPPKPVEKKIQKPKPIEKKIEKPKPVEKPIEKIEQEIIKEEIVQEVTKEEPVIEQPPIKKDIVEQEPIVEQNTPIEKEEDFVETNFSIIRDMALSGLQYPKIARKMRWTGVVEIRLTIDTDGKLAEAVVSKSSGRKLLDDTALRAVLALKDKALPVPKTVSTLILPISFDLK